MSRVITKNDRLYGNWRNMLVRCYDSTYHSYHRYGGRGIKVCERWMTFANFKLDLEETWFEGATLDREDNDGNYEPDNCSWKTKAQNSKPLKYDIKEMLELYEDGMKQADIGKMYGLGQDRISKLLKRARREYS